MAFVDQRDGIIMEMSRARLVWASKPGCSKPVAEIWLGEYDLWFIVFVDDADNTLKVEVFAPLSERISHVIDFIEVERLIDAAKRDLRVMAGSTPISS
jgi:hypothetical protein